MSAESRKRRAQITAAAPKTHVVLALDTYMGDGEGAADYGYAGVNDVYGPFTEEDAHTFAKGKGKENDRFVEYRVKKLSQ